MHISEHRLLFCIKSSLFQDFFSPSVTLIHMWGVICMSEQKTQKKGFFFVCLFNFFINRLLLNLHLKHNDIDDL